MRRTCTFAALTIVFVLSLVAVAAAGTPARAAAIRRVMLPAVGRNVRVYSDYFGDPTSGWSVDDSASRTLAYVNDEYQIVVKNKDWTVYALAPGARLADGAVEVTGRFASGVYGDYGIVFRADSDLNLYQFCVDGSQRYALWKAVADSWTQLAGWTTSTRINAGQTPNRLRATRTGPSIALWANGYYLTTVTDATLQGVLRAGVTADTFATPNVDVRFDEFRLYPVVAGATSTAPLGAEGCNQR